LDCADEIAWRKGSEPLLQPPLAAQPMSLPAESERRKTGKPGYTDMRSLAMAKAVVKNAEFFRSGPRNST
jgi:hypothetical protein